METLKIINSETSEKGESGLEAAEMKENIIRRAEALLNDNGKLTRKVLEKKWNTVEKGKILDELSECRIDTKKTAEGYFSATGVGDGVVDEYGEKKAA
jgi:hypothetical protein